jgi:hypothetical protein
MAYKDPFWWREYYAKNKQRIKKTQRAYVERHPERVKEQRKRHWAQNSKRIAALRRERDQKLKRDDPETLKRGRRERHERYYAKHRETILQRQRELYALKRHKIPMDEWRAMLKAHQGLCAICQKPQSGKRENLFIDHCHATGVVRGLLCTNCNRGLGGFKDNIDSLRRAIAYLSASRQRGAA